MRRAAPSSGRSPIRGIRFDKAIKGVEIMNSATPGLLRAGVPVSQAAPKDGSGRADAGILDVAESLHDEFSAPIGILDVERRRWTVAVGAEEPLFPRVDARLLEVDRGSPPTHREGRDLASARAAVRPLARPATEHG